MAVVQRRVFPDSFKREAVEKAATSGLSMSMVAAELGVHETVLRRWMLQFSPAGEATVVKVDHQPNLKLSVPPSDLAAENVRLRAEIERLREDRETLKRALAIVFAELR